MAGLDALIDDLVAAGDTLDARGFDRLLRRHPKEGRGFFSKREILRGFRAAPGRWPVSELAFAERLRTCPTRSIAGVLPVAVLTKPFPCPGRCVFCPSDVRQPKSYLSNEPGCQRATANRFDPYLQVWNRLAAYRDMGHPTGKVELIVLGGTWSAYPDDYQRWFVTRLFEALNDFGAGVDRRAEALAALDGSPALAERGRGHAGRYNDVVRRALRDGGDVARRERASGERLAAAQRRNEHARARCVGLVLETRPDHVDDAELVHLRTLGVTKVQLGVQHLDDAVLARNQRGHDADASRHAIGRLRGAGFKIHAHWMPNLLGATPEGDRRDFRRLFDDPGLRPDELKVYPCSLVESAELVRFHASGEWRPYDPETLVALLADCLERVPEWCRISRVIRDIPSQDILVGNTTTNLREVVEARLAREGRALRDIRAREVRGGTVDPARVVLSEQRYATSIGVEHFLEARTDAGRLAGFLRLTVPTSACGPIEELYGRAIVRELHVYGAALDPGERRDGRAQHGGIGARLLARAAELADAAGRDGLAVISAVGTRGYYRRQGFEDGALYQHRPGPPAAR